MANRSYTVKECLRAIRNSPEKEDSDAEVKKIVVHTITNTTKKHIPELLAELSFWRKNIFFELKQSLLKQKAA